MEFYDTVRNRRSIRGYKKRAVPSESLARIKEAVQLAPTACNLQPFKFLLAESKGIREQICQFYPQPWLAEAPVIVVALGNRSEAWKRLNGSSAHVIDVSIAMEHFVLASSAEGLATCWICAFDQEAMHSALELSADWDVVAITPLGYADAEPRPLSRKSLEKLFSTV